MDTAELMLSGDFDGNGEISKFSVDFENVFHRLTQKFEIDACIYKHVDSKLYELVDNHERLPRWWKDNHNFLLVPRNSKKKGIPNIVLHPGYENCTNFIIFCNDDDDYPIEVWGQDGLMFVSPQAGISGARIGFGGGFIFVGPNVRHTSRLNLDCRNGGRIRLCGDALIASDVLLMTDDCHTIYSVSDGKRTNPYGGTIDVGEHVWIGNQAIILGDSTVAGDCIIGSRSFVRGQYIEPRVVLAGSPARIVTVGVNWDHRDLPSERAANVPYEASTSLYFLMTAHHQYVGCELDGTPVQLAYTFEIRDRLVPLSKPYASVFTDGPLKGFRMLKSGGNEVSLLKDGLFLCAEPQRQALLHNRSAIGPWEKFIIVPEPQSP
jgi:acetyltransferase-like isoleucine patch superfamily enzyme